MARLPTPGGDAGNWGEILNDFLAQEHNPDGTLKRAGDIAAKYVKPEAGIPKNDLDGTVQASLDKADASQSATEVASAIALYGDRTPTLATLGDSITSNGYNNGGAGERNWGQHAAVASGGKLFFVTQFGGGGYRTAQIRDTLLPQLLAWSGMPIGYCAVLAGANDLNKAGYTTAQYITEYRGILDRLHDSGVMPVICALTPNATQAYAAQIHAWNAWLAQEARVRGVPFVDWTRDVMDPATACAWKSGLSTDGVHPEGAGARAMGIALWRELESYIAGLPRWKPYLAVSNTDPTNLVTNGLFLLDGNADGAADNWTISGHASSIFTKSIVPATDGETVGNWQRVTALAGNPNFVNAYPSASIVGWSPGDRIGVGCRLQMPVPTSGGPGQIGMMAWNSTITRACLDLPWFVNGWKHQIDPTTFYGEGTIRDDLGANTPRFIFSWSSGEGWWQVAQVTVRNLTALGLA